MRHFIATALGIVLVFFSIAYAAEKQPGLGMVTGAKTGTYFAIGNDIAHVAEASGLKINIKDSSGSINNIKRITSGENAALGIVQSDVLGFLSRSQNPESQKIAEQLRMVFPFYREEVHLLARKEIASFASLAGKRVVVGEEGSGSLLTAINLLSMMNVTPSEVLKIPPAEGVVAVLEGKADAMVFVGGKPVRLFSNLAELKKQDNGVHASLLEGVHFVPLNDPKMLKEYATSTITPADYGIGAATVPTIAVTAIMVDFNFSAQENSYQQTRCKELHLLGRAIRKNLDYLKQHGHPKWKEVNLDAKVGVWKQDSCIVENPAAKAPKAGSALEEDLIGVAKGQKP